MKQSCAFYRESISDTHSQIFTDCKILEDANCDNCKFFKTWEQYNNKAVEKAIKEYGRTHK